MATGIPVDHNLDELIQKITDSADEVSDELAVNLFCLSVRNDPTLIKKATELIVSKIRSPNIAQSRKAIELLEECMSKCGPEFQIAVARFQFLNELIRLVSKKFSGDDTPAEIRNKILDCLSLWTVQYPDRTKIKEAYETLLRSGVQHEERPTIARNLPRTGFVDAENDKLIEKLVKSSKPEDHQRAKLLIQYLYKQDAKRSELATRQKNELQEAKNSADILNEIVDRWMKEDTIDNEELAKEFYTLCQKSKAIVMRIPELIEDNGDLLNEAIEVNDLLLLVIQKYEESLSKEKVKTSSTKQQSSVADLMSAPASIDSSDKSHANPLDELSDIFSQNVNTTIPNSFDLLEPLSVTSTAAPAKTEKNEYVKVEKLESKPSSRTLSEIDKLSEELFKQNLNATERMGNFKKESNKIPIKDLVKETSKEEDGHGPTSQLAAKVEESKPESNDTLKPFAEIPGNLLEDILESAFSKSQLAGSSLQDFTEANILDNVIDQQEPDHLLLDDLLIVSPSHSTNSSTDVCQQPNSVVTAAEDVEIIKIPDENDTSKKTVRHLSEINVTLNSIQPSRERPRIVMDDIQGLRVTLNFALDRPCPYVSVIVISTINQSSLPISSYQFDASVPKPCKLRLLAPTGNQLPAVRPFRPPTEDIQQILLLSNPTHKSVDLMCIISYQQGDDPDQIKECVIIKDIPFCE